MGGYLPPELEPRDLSHFPAVLLRRGSSEEWYDAAKMEHDVELLREKGVDIRPCVFQGGHEWTNELRAEAGRFLDEVFRPASLPAFFFQAEDGIRDRNVTGVQTCALPICRSRTSLPERWPATFVTANPTPPTRRSGPRWRWPRLRTL